MCVLCLIQSSSRKIASMLSYLIFPLLLLCILSQFLPQNFKFPITNPQIACFLVLLSTLFWYEVLLPYLSTWRARYNSRVREMRRIEIIEMQKLKSLSTRRCRNCFRIYREQNPLGGKFMCAYCGHASKKPVLELPEWKCWADDSCFVKKSVLQVAGAVFLRFRVVFRSVFSFWSKNNKCLDGKNDRLLCSKESFQESRVEKARRKALEKKQARLEREILEEEERRQREEVTKLVAEHKKMRGEKCESKNMHMDSSCVDHEKESKKEREMRRRERRKEKDRCSSKSSNSDVEELEKRLSKGSEKKSEFDKKTEIEKQRVMIENLKSQVSEGGKSRYFSKMPSKISNGTSLSTRVIKAGKHNAEYVGDQHLNAKRKPTLNVDHRPVANEVQPHTTVSNKSWRQLFTHTSTAAPEPDTNRIMFGNLNVQLEAKNSFEQEVTSFFSMPIVGYSSPIGKPNVSPNSVFPPIKEPKHNSLVVEDELFEDPCYFPKQLEKIPLDKNTNLPSPIEALLSSEERQVLVTPSKKSNNLNESCNAQEFGTWEMWGTPLVRDGLEIDVGPCGLFSPIVQSKSNQEHHLISQIATERPLPSIVIPKKACVGNFENGGLFSPLSLPLGPNFNRNDTWAHDIQHQSLSPILPFDLINSTGWRELCPNNSSAVYPFEVPQTNCLSKEEWTLKITPNTKKACSLSFTNPNIPSGFLTTSAQGYV